MKIRTIVFLIIPVLLLYLSFFPHRLAREVATSLVWVNEVTSENKKSVTDRGPDRAPGFTPSDGDVQSVKSFRLGRVFGFIRGDGVFAYVGNVAYGVALGEDTFINYPNVVSNLAVQEASGRIRMGIPTSRYPFYLSDRLFLISSDRLTLSELDEGGMAMWERTFPSIVTAIDGNGAVLTIGMLDGRIIVLDGRGDILFNAVPEGSRISAVFGCALSPDADRIAVVFGIDPQRLLLYRLEEEADTYNVELDLPLEGANRRPVSVEFSEDGTVVFVETADAILCLDVDTYRIVTEIEFQGRIGGMIPRGRGALSYFITSNGGNSVLRLFESGGRRVYEERFTGDVVFLSESDAGILLGVDNDLGLFRITSR